MDVVYYTNQGGREINEDSLFMTDGAYVVCDGLGGHASGEVASNCAVKVMSELCANKPPYTPELVNTFYLRANQAVINLKEQALTTIVGGFVRDGIFYYQGVGDSRLYYFRDGKIFAQTKDDSVCQAAVDLGTMNYEDIRTSEDRSRLLKVLGNDPGLKIMRKYDPIRIKKGDAFLVCSDGFWEHVLDQEMTENLEKAYDAEEWLNLMLKIQYNRAKNRDDNYTVICAIVEEKDEAETVPVSKNVIENALTSIPESKAEMLHEEVDVEQFESMPNKEVEVEMPEGSSFVRRTDTGNQPNSVPYESQFRRYNDNENVTLSYDTPTGEYGPDRFDEADREYYDEEPERKGFFSRLFRR
ncbi:MAG: protein phosphatase 2C domain-containing protein [Lachnospiraceae bacterium]|nr:protein phosphatase 2C domain-containing protein [Lachnospiraceae bacterium]